MASSRKRAALPRAARFTKQFKKDWDRLSRTGRYDMPALKQVMLQLIANETALHERFRDHALLGEWSDHRECHIGGDFLLIYQCDQEAIVFVRAGTHSELF